MSINILLEDLNEEPPGKVQAKQNIIHYLIRNIFTNRCCFRHRTLRTPKQSSSKYNAIDIGVLVSFRYPWDNFIFTPYVANGIFNKK